jgi:hypothetical protein
LQQEAKLAAKVKANEKTQDKRLQGLMNTVGTYHMRRTFATHDGKMK